MPAEPAVDRLVRGRLELRVELVVTFSPPPNTRPAPYRSTSCCVTQVEK